MPTSGSVDGILVHHGVTSSIEFTSNHFFTWAERLTVGVTCLAQEHNAVSLRKARTQTS